MQGLFSRNFLSDLLQLGLQFPLVFVEFVGRRRVGLEVVGEQRRVVVVLGGWRVAPRLVQEGAGLDIHGDSAVVVEGAHDAPSQYDLLRVKVKLEFAILDVVQGLHA